MRPASAASAIARWKQALELAPDNFSAHEELARLAEQRDELDLAAEHFEKAWRLRPDHRALLLDLGALWCSLNRVRDANAALLAASRGAEPRVAEEARELLPSRYPYVYEFEKALTLDPANTGASSQSWRIMHAIAMQAIALRLISSFSRLPPQPVAGPEQVSARSI